MHPLRIPFKRSFKHAAAERSVTQSIWVEAESPAGLRGFGEGCPREYVTGESIESALTFFRAIEDEVAPLVGLDELRNWAVANGARIDANPAAWCAVELALLDLLGKENSQPVEALLSLPSIAGPFQYTAVLGAEPIAKFEEQLGRCLQIGFRDFKVKLSGDRADDRPRIAALTAKAGAVASLRLDANNLWSDANTAIEYLRNLDGSFFALEEPLAVADYSGLRRVAESSNVKIILDESFLRQEQFECLRPFPGPWIINLRISKMGGLLRSLAIAEQAARVNLPIIIGCQVGETSLLTRAALTVAQAAKGKGLMAQEGAFGTHLLANDIVDRPLMFGAEGSLDVSPYRFPQSTGFGLNPEVP